MSFGAALTAIEECLDGTLGSVRTTTSDDLSRDAYAAADDFTLAQRAMSGRRFEVEVVGQRRTTAVGPPTADRAVLALDILIVLVVPTASEVEGDLRAAVRALAENIYMRAQQALMWPGNLVTTVAGASTGIVSGCLSKCGPARVTREDWKARIYRLEAPATALVLVSQPVS